MQAVCVKCEHPHVCEPTCIIADHHHGTGASMLSRESVGVIDELPIRCNKRGGTHLGSIHWKGKGRLSRRCSRHQARKDIYLAYLHQRNRCKGRYARQTRGAVPAPLPAGGGRFNMPRRRGPWTNASFLIRGAAPEWHAGIPVLLKSLPAWRRSVRACPLTPSTPCPPTCWR